MALRSILLILPALAPPAHVGCLTTAEADDSALLGRRPFLEYDDDLETQLRTAMNETESLRIQRDSLREDLKALTREVIRNKNTLHVCAPHLCV